MATIEAFPIPGIREPFSCLTHLLAIPFFVAYGFFLVQRGRGNACRTLSLAILVVSTVCLLAVSSAYHVFGAGAARNLMRQLDVAAVFTLIAGTATPIHSILFRGFNRWAPLLVVWMVAVAGIILRTVFPASLPPGVGTLIFLVMGWGGLVACVLLWRRFGYAFVQPLLWGGMAYTVGAGLLLLKWPRLIPGIIGAHELWHVAVLVGLALHWKFVFQFADGFAHVKTAPLWHR